MRGRRRPCARRLKLLALGLAVGCAGCFVVALILGGALILSLNAGLPLPFVAARVTPTASPTTPARPDFVATSTPSAQPPSPSPTRTPSPTPEPTRTRTTAESMAQLLDADPPLRDLFDLSRRLKGIPEIPTAVADSAPPLSVGATQSFFVVSTDSNRRRTVTAELLAARPHVYFWVESGLAVDKNAMHALVDRFEREIYPTTRDFFGSEWTPGVDGDPHLYILYASGLGNAVAGYYSSIDEYPLAVNPYSNQHEMFYLNADVVDLADPDTGGTLAHEFHHMIHWAADLNEDTWLNEGFSELAAYLNGYDPGGFFYSYLAVPDVQLNDWPASNGNSLPHYGASFLFTAYFLHRFGDDATQALVGEPANGLKGLDAVLARRGLTDPATGTPITADDFFADWVVANYLDDPGLADGRFSYAPLDSSATDATSVEAPDCPASPQRRTVHQYGVDYIRIACRGEVTVNFAGAAEVRVVPADPVQGEYAFWSNRGDESDMTLTRAFDFSAVAGPFELSYQAWSDLEADYDYVYLEASTDRGDTWTLLKAPSGTDENPTGGNYGWGYTGASPGWIQETVDLSDYAGQADVLLRFEYVTDSAVNGAGFLLDELAIPAIGYSADFETDDGGWKSVGWVRLSNRVPQAFRVQVIEQGPAGARVNAVQLDANNAGRYTVRLGRDVTELVLVVAGTARGTNQPAEYEYSISRK